MTEARGLEAQTPRQAGFTLLEVMIAIAILVVAFASILAVESGAINASTRGKQMSVVAMLAKSKMVEFEYQFEGRTFDEVKKEDAGQFPEPFQDYKWATVIKEIKFPSLNVGGGGSKPDGSAASSGEADQMADMLTKVLTNFLSKALREATVTISWKKGEGAQSFAISTYWVDLNHEFSLTE